MPVKIGKRQMTEPQMDGWTAGWDHMAGLCTLSSMHECPHACAYGEKEGARMLFHGGLKSRTITYRD